MPKGLWTLTWIELKVFTREPMGFVSALIIPVVFFLGFSQLPSMSGNSVDLKDSALQIPLAVFAVILIGITNVTSLVTIISIYREGGVLKRLRSTPLRPYTILSAHVFVKLIMTALSLSLLLVAGKSFGSLQIDVNVVSFSIAIVFSFVSLMSIGFVIASLVPTARFARPVASLIIIPLLALSPVFIPIEVIDKSDLMCIVNLSPITHVTNLLSSTWDGNSWGTQFPAIVGLSVNFILCLALSTKVFRWE